MRILTGVLVFSVCGPLAAKSITYPVSVPMECAQLAQREHVPMLIENRIQALRAKYKLYRLSKSDPLVAQCRNAVERLKAQSRGK